MKTTFKAPFPRGNCPIHAFGPDDRSVPLVLFFPDAFGPRPASFSVAEEIAAEGWRVLMMDPFYEHGDYAPIPPKSIFEGGPERDQLMAMFGTMTVEKIYADVAAMIALATERSDEGVPFAAAGYCMGGRYVLSALVESERVVFGGAFHAGHLAPEEGDGPHLRLGSVKGRVYVGAAGIDPMYDSDQHGRLARALREADTDHTIENYKGAAHGWVFSDIPIYDAAAAAKHMRRLKENLGELFARA